MSEIAIPANFGSIVLRNPQSGNYTILSSDQYVVATVTAKTFTLPAASAVPAGWNVIIGTIGGISLTVARASGDTIGSAAGNLTLATTSAQVRLVSDGVSNWEAVRPGT